jgi:hypothetical protein
MGVDTGWFAADKEGLAKMLSRRGGDGSITGVAWLLFELVQNGWDAGARRVEVRLEPERKGLVWLTCVDDGDGFVDLRHAYTLFAESPKKGDPEKGGRFDVGEKLVLSLCEEATIASTKGSIVFDRDGRRRQDKQARTEKGSSFRGLVRMTKVEVAQVLQAAQLLLVPEGVETTVNCETIRRRKPAASFRATLTTEKGDELGHLRRVRRETDVRLYEPRAGELPMLYELGIPVVELDGGEPWHLDVRQRVPLNIDRDNVTPAYLRELRVHVLNQMHEKVRGQDQATRGWVRDAAASPEAVKEAVAHVFVERFGERAVAQDPSDPEGTKLAVHAGHTVVSGGSLSKGEWDNARKFELLPRAGIVTPSRPEQSEGGRVLDLSEETEGMRGLRKLVAAMGKVLLGGEMYAAFIDNPKADLLASYGGGVVTYNVPRLREHWGPDWFDQGPTEKQTDITLHELSHALASDHLSKKYNDACTSLGAKLAFHIASDPEFFRRLSWG